MKTDTDYLNIKISSAEILGALQNFTGEELCNCTYGGAMEVLMQNGHFLLVSPMSTHALATGTGWFVEIVSLSNGEVHKVSRHTSDVFYKSWEEAMYYAILYVTNKYGAKKEQSEPDAGLDDSVVGMGHKMYSRHTEEDPFPFE